MIIIGVKGVLFPNHSQIILFPNHATSSGVSVLYDLGSKNGPSDLGPDSETSTL